jgi:1,4-alpha-glucan branching enzyme
MTMSIKKQYFKNKGICKVTFSVPPESEGNEVQKVHVVGEFNNWSISVTPMKRTKNGVFTASVDLKPGQEYQFRYLLDDNRWDNDTEADEFADTPYGDARNSVIVI